MFQNNFRPIAENEKWYFLSKTICQMSLQVEKPSFVPGIVEKLKNRTLGLKIKFDGKNFIRVNDEIDVLKLPSSVSTAEEASEWSRKHFFPDFSKRLATIAANDNFISLTVNHAVGDGGYLKNLLNSLSDPYYDNSAEEKLPIPLESYFEDRIRDAETKGVKVVDNDLSLTRALTAERKPDARIENALTRSILFRIDSKDLQCYNQQIKAPKSLTEYLWTSICLSAMAFNKKVSDFGCCTWVDTRSFLPKNKQKSLDICNNFSGISAFAKAKEDSTIASIGREMRIDFDNKYRNNYLFSYLKAAAENEPLLKPKGVGVELSNLGPISIKKPIVDVHFGIQMNSEYVEDLFSVMNSSIISEENNTVNINFRYGPNKITDQEAKQLSKYIVHTLKHIPSDTKINDAIKMLQQIQ